MVNEFRKLTNEERALLYKAPVLLSVLTSCSYNDINQIQKRDAIKLAHLKTFTADPLLIPYYEEVEKNFESQFEAIAQKYYPFDDAQRLALKAEIEKVAEIISKLDNRYANILKKSFQSYVTHVKRSIHSVFQDFLFPLHIPGLND